MILITSNIHVYTFHSIYEEQTAMLIAAMTLTLHSVACWCVLHAIELIAFFDLLLLLLAVQATAAHIPVGEWRRIKHEKYCCINERKSKSK